MSPHRTTRVRRDVVVVGASAGGVEALIAFIGALPADLPATVLVVLHVPATGGSALPRILARATSLDVRIARHGEPLEPATVLVAPPDRHLVLRSGRVHLTRGPRENGHRPAVDVLFRSTALAARARTVAVVLSGSLDDGTAGSAAVIRAGGTVLAQDPADALYSGMPASVIRDVGALHMDTATGLGVLVGRLVAEPVEVTDPAHLPPVEEVEVEMAELDAEAMAAHDRPGVPAGFGCPDCGGSLFRIDDHPLRYRCRVGHAWSSEGLLAEQSQALEGALWMALRGLEEKSALSATLAERASERGSLLSQERFLDQALQARRSAELVRQLLQGPIGELLERDAGLGLG